MAFVPCQGKSACRELQGRCLTCGRTLEEVAQLRLLIDDLSNMAIEFDYDNTQQFADYVARKLIKKVAHRRAELEETQDAT